VAVPGTYALRFTVGSWAATEPLEIVEDPRISRSGVTTADLQEQFDHNMRVRELVSEVDKTVARVRTAQAKIKDGSIHVDAAQTATLNDIAARLITPSIRYSQPELQTHITYLYSMTNTADQKVGRDAIERYEVLKKQLADIEAELERVLPAM
jgi:light-regulated signal transduction histidine kinase (bacteriophytochrome)